MTNQPGRAPRPALDLRGAVDLSSLTPRPPAAAAGSAVGAPGSPGAPVPAAGAAVIDVTDATFVTEVVQRSETVPVVIDFWATWCQPCTVLSPILEKLAAELGGRILLAKVDVDANPQLSQAFQVQSIPSVFAVLKGQPIPLFQGAQPEAQIKAVLTELLRVAASNGVTGTIAVDPEPAAEEELEPGEEPLPPLHQAAYDAIDSGDLPAAVTAYERALRENPADELARVGLAQVRLLQRTQGVELPQARAAAAAAPDDVAAQLLMADLDVLGGHIEDAFSRLVDLVRRTVNPDRERVRKHLVELFDLVGPQDDRVPAARLALANALF